MTRIRYLQVGWVMLLAVLLLGLVVTPAGARSKAMQHIAQLVDNTTSVNATIYITKGTLEPIFQSRIEQQVPVAVNGAISSIVSKLPQRDQGWARQMASTLIQPSASLTSLTTEQGGLATSLHVTLYPGDPQPIDANILVKHPSERPQTPTPMLSFLPRRWPPWVIVLALYRWVIV